MKKPSAAVYVIAAILAAAAGFLAVYVTFGPYGNGAPEKAEQGDSPDTGTPAPPADPDSPATKLAGLNRGEMAAVTLHDKPVVLPEVTFLADGGETKSLAEWRGKVVLLNLWATWCAPCRKEMPGLDRLKAEFGGDDFDVVAISIDRGGLDVPRAFLAEIGIENLALYNAESGKVTSALKAFGMPTTLLIDREGQEIARLVGPAEWDSDDAKALIRAAIGTGEG